MKLENLLPIGSVVLLKNAEKSLMIIGILTKTGDKQSDYIGVVYPEGYLNAETFFTFNHEDILQVKYFGFMDAEYQVFRADLAKKLGEING